MNLRPELAQHLRQRLQAFSEGFRQNLALIGPAGSGKTYQLQQLVAEPTPSLSLVFCPLYRESAQSFLKRLLCAILPAADRDVPNTTAAVRQVEGLLARRLYGEAFNRALDVIPILIEERQRPCVLLLDEFLFLEDLGLAHAFHELGKRVMTSPSTLFLLSSSSPYRARMILRERLHLLFGQFELVSLEGLDAAIASLWVQRELKGLRGVSTLAPFLLQWLGAYPWYLTVMITRLKERALLEQSRELTEALFLQTAWDLLGTPPGALHQWCASRLEAVSQKRLGARAVDALIQVASGVRTTTDLGKRIGRGGLPEALQLLVEQDLAERKGMCWVVTDPILRTWLSTVCAAQRADARQGGAERREGMEQHLRMLWSRWMQATHLSFAEQVVALLTKFCDDTVSLDSKTGRLPRFEAIRTQPPVSPGSDAYLIADGPGRRWCATVHSEPADEYAIASFDAFCHAQSPKPSRKVVIVKSGMDDNARLLAKATNMWVWQLDDLKTLHSLYGPL